MRLFLANTTFLWDKSLPPLNKFYFKVDTGLTFWLSPPHLVVTNRIVWYSIVQKVFPFKMKQFDRKK